MSGDIVADRHVHPATIPLRVLKEAPSTILGLPAAYAVTSRPGIIWVLLFAAAIAAAAILYQLLAWARFRYGIGERELVIESGILSRNRRSIPFERIQDVDIERGPLARLFGLARLRIETGGGARDEGVLDSVTLAEAERLRAALRAARGEAGPLAEPEEDQRERLLFTLSFSRLILVGLLNFSMVWIAGIFAILQLADDWLPFDIYERSLWQGAGEGLKERFSAGAAALVAVIALSLGVVTGLAKTFTQDFGFRLTLEREGLRRQRGLFTRSDVLIPRARTQLAIVETGPFRRLFGASRITFQTLSAGTGDDKAGPQVAAPLARQGEAERILAAVGAYRIADPSVLEPVSSRRILRRIAGGGVAAAAVLTAAFFFPPALLLFLPLLIWAVLLGVERRFHRFGVDGGLLFVQSGVWRQRQWIVPMDKIQSLTLSRSWLQRRLDLASLSVDTAGASVLGGARIEDLRDDRARALLDQLAAASRGAI